MNPAAALPDAKPRPRRSGKVLRTAVPAALVAALFRLSRAPAVSGGWPAAEPPGRSEDPMIALFLLLVIAAIVLGIVGVVAKGLLYLLIIGIVVFLGALLLGALRMRRRPGRRSAR
jgi:hypothetical protein